MKRLKNIKNSLSPKELGKALIKHAELMNDSLNSISDSGINSLKLHNMRILCELYEEYNLKLKTLEEEKIKNDPSNDQLINSITNTIIDTMIN